MTFLCPSWWLSATFLLLFPFSHHHHLVFVAANHFHWNSVARTWLHRGKGPINASNNNLPSLPSEKNVRLPLCNVHKRMNFIRLFASKMNYQHQQQQLRGGHLEQDNLDLNLDSTGDLPASIHTDMTETFPKRKRKRTKKILQHDEEERYSRQMYAVGARAHGLIRSTTVILDGPLGGGFDASSHPNNKWVKEYKNLDEKEGFMATSSNGKEVPSGLLYEVAKNMALSGVGRIILVTSNEDTGYFDGGLDDLGAAYRRAALAEILPQKHHEDMNANENCDSNKHAMDEEGYQDEIFDGAALLGEYIQRLNPGVQVDVISRERLLQLLCEKDDHQRDDIGTESDEEEKEVMTLGSNAVMVCVDRSISTQLEINEACRYRCRVTNTESSVPFVSIESAGVFSRIFCDFGPSFVVVDEDGEQPRSTLLDFIEEIPDSGFCNVNENKIEKLLTLHCLEGEQHDVSCGNVIQIKGDHSSTRDGAGVIHFPLCEVVSVKSPRCFTVREWENKSFQSNTSFSALVEGNPRSFSRVKLPKTISFASLMDILQPALTVGNEENTSLKSEIWNDNTLFAPSDLDKSFDPARRKAITDSMVALDKFVAKYGRLPFYSSKLENDEIGDVGVKQRHTDIERFQKLAREELQGETTDVWDSIVKRFARTCRAKFTPVQALVGAVGAQEVLKAATSLYNPVHQFLLYDCDEVLQTVSHSGDDSEDEDDDYTPVSKGLAYILGDKLCKKLASSRIFLVGAGAIGCELLKNLASMGAGTGNSLMSRGSLIITDMDTIEKSNLSRQLLFRDHDVGEFKSSAARSSILRFLPSCHIEAHTSRIGEDEDGTFDDDFWSLGCDYVLNALDNLEARLFVDSQCVAHGLNVIDAGTLGSKGNVQVVVANQSESYGSSADPPELDIPVCTLKNFPYEISHTIQWARDLFDGYFVRRPRQANDHVGEIAKSEDITNLAQSLIHKLGVEAVLNMAEELEEDLGVFPFTVGELDSSDSEYVSAVKKVCLEWAVQQAKKYFFVATVELLQKHPLDSLDDDNSPFWSGTRRVPKPLRFISLDSDEDEVSAEQVIINERIAQFVKCAARLRIESFLSEYPKNSVEESLPLVSLEDALRFLDETFANGKKSGDPLYNLSDSIADGDDVLAIIVKKLNGAKNGASFIPQLNVADFEKDNETNGHVAFVTAASNLRALAYGIPEVDASETRRVAGRIVPAMISTTSLVSALSCLELVKFLKGFPLEVHRNAFVNLALPFFAFSSPLPAEKIPGFNGKLHTIWNRLIIEGRGKSSADEMSLRTFLDELRKLADLSDDAEIATLSYGPYMIYANFLHSQDVGLLDSPLMKILKDSILFDDDGNEAHYDKGGDADIETKHPAMTNSQKKALIKLSRKRFVEFTATVEDLETGEEFELPSVRLLR